MTEPVVDRAGRRTAGGLVPVLVAAAAVVGVCVWLLVRDAADITYGYLGGPAAIAAAAYAAHRLGRTVTMPRSVRTFWRQVSRAVVLLFIGACTSLAMANNEAGMSLIVAVPNLLGTIWAMAAFAKVPLGPRTPLAWVRQLLDGTTVAVAGTLIFWYVVLSFAPPGVDITTRAAAGAIGVAGLLALYVIGKAVAVTDGPVDSVALKILAIAPLVAVTTSVVLIVGNEMTRLVLSVVTHPLVALSFTGAAYRQRAAQLRPDAPAPEVAFQNRSFWQMLPFAAVTATAGLVIVISAREMGARDQAVIVGAVLIVACVVIRQLLGLRENTALLIDIRSQQAQLERLAMTDTLTGLANRTKFGAAIAERIGEHQPATVLLIDIDDFKLINDTMGPALGDQLLYEVGQRLRATSAERELPARLGGDEFALLVDAATPAEAEDAAGRLLQVLSEPFRVGEHQLLAHASIGVAIADAGGTADEVLRNADIAMYAAKDAGKAAWALFRPEMRSDVMNHARLGSELHNAIVRNELFLLYQPVFDIVSGRLHGAEALVRWQHPARGLVSPGDFIPVAERSGLIVPLGSWVLRTACEQLARWQSEHGDGAIKAINVNVAVRQLREPGFVDEVAAVLSETDLLPENLVLEVTESSVAEGRQVRETLHTLHEMGVRLALDDFGTGASSLSLLRAFPVDVLKLDKSFVDGIADGEDRGRLAVAAAVAQLAEYLQLSAVAEGIESEAQLERLRAMGYRLGQGFYMAKPLPADEAGALMTADPVHVS
jgi:diguanylate cyclase (GGDEF)-like protein